MPYCTGASFVMETGILLSNLCWMGARKTGQTMTLHFQRANIENIKFLEIHI